MCSVNILLIDDDDDVGELTKLALNEIDMDKKLYWIKDAVEALDFIHAREKYKNQAFSPKVIFLDLKLPKINGFQLLSHIRNCKRTQNTPVVVLSSSNQIKDIEKSYANGANSYIVKPVRYEHFSTIIKAISVYWINYNAISEQLK